LAHTTGNRRTLNNPNSILVPFYRDIEVHKLVLADISFDYVDQGIDAFVGLG
jgi:hypothetical protein